MSDAEIARHKDPKRLFFNYHRATKPLYKKPLYKDPRTFIALLIIVLLAILIADGVGKERGKEPKPRDDVRVGGSDRDHALIPSPNHRILMRAMDSGVIG